MNSLWGDEFNIEEDDIKSIVKKTKTKKVVKEVSVETKLKSKSVSVYEKIDLIKKDVDKILGHYKEDTVCIRDYNEFIKYIDAALDKKIIAVDTETNNTLNTIDCKLMGLCLYVPGQKNAYIPVNHCNFELDENGNVKQLDKLDNQITEDQIREQLSRLVGNVKMIFHNASFDIEVIKSTCGIRLKADWDTLLGAKLLDENELAGLKAQYKIHIDPEQDKYSIEHLFKGLPYAIFDPELFALYAATDSFMTLKLYEYQLEQFNLDDNKDIYKVMTDIEVPCIDAIVDMELNGIEIDSDYAERMSKEYHRRADDIQRKIDEELFRLSPIINEWKLTPEANAQQRVYPAKKTKMTEEKIAQAFPLIDEKGLRYKIGSKSKVEQLSDPIELNSVTQLQILLYDILKITPLNKNEPRATDADTMDELAKKVPICKLIVEKRGVDILINTFIDKMPEIKNVGTGRVHAKFNQYGAATGRLSSSDPNLQNIP